MKRIKTAMMLLLLAPALLMAAGGLRAAAGPDRAVYVGDTVYFDSTGTIALKTVIKSWRWSFGDGSVAFGEMAEHRYAAPGAYTATLRVTGENGASASDSVVITVMNSGAAPEPDPGAVPKRMKVYVLGNSGWVTTAHQPGTVLVGGSSEPDEAMIWMTQRAAGGDFVVIRADTSNGYQDYIYNQIGGVDSVHTLVVSSTTFANSTYVETVIRNAEALFIAGGDQTQYYNLWKNTRLEAAVHYLVNEKRAAAGGNSAGMAVLGAIDYIPLSTGVISSEALNNPYHVNMNDRRSDFLEQIPYTIGLLTDTHFSERNRLGRFIAFIARNIADGLTTVAGARGVACDEGATVCIDGNGLARIYGWDNYNDYAFFLKADTFPDTCVSGQKLHWSNGVTIYKVRGLSSGVNTFNLSGWTGSGGATESVNVINGVIDNNIQEPN